MYKFIQFDIVAVENLKLGKFDRDTNNWYSHSYIPGSVIKGAVIWGIVQRKGPVDKRLLNGETVFYNAYPLVDGKNAIPMIQGYVGDKQKVRANMKEIPLRHSFNYDDENVVPYNNYEFIVYEKGSSYVKGYNPKKIEKLHINKKDAAEGSKTRMFRYEAIQKGESFRGYIKVEEDLASDVYDVLNEKIIYLGGSRGSGYGKCEINNISYIPSLSLFDSDTDVKDDLYIYFLSDAILYYGGKVCTYLPEELLKEKLGLKGECKFISAFISLDKAATYNTMYHTNTVCYASVTKGSVMKYKVNEKIDPEKIRELAFSGVGIRKEDRYGQIAILGSIPDKLTISGYERDDSIGSKNLILSEEDEKLVHTVLKKIFYNRNHLETERLVLKLLNSKQKIDDNVQTQIGKILNLFQNSVYKTETGFKKELKEYLDNIEQKRGKEVWHKLKRVTFNNSSMLNVQQLLLDFVNENPNAVFDEFKKNAEKGIRLGKYKYPSEAELKDVVYNLQIFFFTRLFEQFIRLKR